MSLSLRSACYQISDNRTLQMTIIMRNIFCLSDSLLARHTARRPPSEDRRSDSFFIDYAASFPSPSSSLNVQAEEKKPARRDNALEAGPDFRRKRRERSGSLVDREGRRCRSTAFSGQPISETSRKRQKKFDKLHRSIVSWYVFFGTQINTFFENFKKTLAANSHQWRIFLSS